MCATLGNCLQKKKNQGGSFIFTQDAIFSQIFGHNKVFYHVWNFIYNNVFEFALLK